MKKLFVLTLFTATLATPNALADLSENTTQNITTIYTPPAKVTIDTPSLPINIYVAKPSAEHAQELQKAIDGTNALRQAQGLTPLRYDDNLSAYAQFRATEIEQKFSHTRPNGEPYKAGMNTGFAVGENIAAGKATAEETVLQFRDSPKHYATILHDKFTKIGMGLAYIPNSKYQYYWVQIFGADNTQSAYAFENELAISHQTKSTQDNTSQLTATATGF